jgi:hypothetical protein
MNSVTLSCFIDIFCLVLFEGLYLTLMFLASCALKCCLLFPYTGLCSNTRHPFQEVENETLQNCKLSTDAFVVTQGNKLVQIFFCLVTALCDVLDFHNMQMSTYML